jgi:hypothetical protein
MDDTEDRRGDGGDDATHNDAGDDAARNDDEPIRGDDEDEPPERDGEDVDGEGEDTDSDGDTFGVGIHVTEAEFQFVVHVPADIDSGWTDPEAFQRLVERTVWDHLDREATLRGIAQEASVGDTVTLGRVTLRPDETVVETAFRDPAVES